MVQSKLHEGELIEELKKKSGYTYQQISSGIRKTERSLMKWKTFHSLDSEVKEALAQFFEIDVRAFDTLSVREKVLKNYKSPNVRSVVSEKEMPALVKKVDEKVGKLQEDMNTLKQQMERLLRELRNSN